MKTGNLFILVLLTASAGFLSQCDKKAQGIRSADFCDLYKEECKEPGLGATDTYKVSVPESKTGNWRDFGHYLYFHSRQTPGMEIRFFRKLNEEELSEIRKTTRCYYRIHRNGAGVRHEMEGIRFFPDGSGLWCFDYLGSMLIEYHKFSKTLDENPKSGPAGKNGEYEFPFELELSVTGESEWLNEEIQTQARIVWTEEKK